jgi:3-phenylpropionate/trans-cinnamate dioxygenase ferredoxin reductase subunit
MSDESRIVIVGGGPAAKAAAGAYRDAGGRGSLTILAGEDELPYERPPLSKEFLRGEAARADLPLEGEEWFRQRDIELIRGVEVGGLNLKQGVAIASDRKRWEFDRCLLVTGAHPVVPEIAAVDGPRVHCLRTVADAERLAAVAGREVLVIGSGFIGCEAAVSLALRGAAVSIATLESSPQIERLGEEVSGCIAGWLAGYGVDLLPAAELAEISEGERLTARFADGREQPADAVLLALGIVRNDGLARAAGVEVDSGVLVDAAMVSSNPRLLAAGDVALAENTAAGRRIAVEHWGEALNQGEVAGRTLAGEEAGWDVAPGFWSTLGERTVKYAGWGDGWDEVRFEQRDAGFVAWYGRGGETVGVLAHERDADYEAGRRLVEERAPWR